MFLPCDEAVGPALTAQPGLRVPLGLLERLLSLVLSSLTPSSPVLCRSQFQPPWALPPAAASAGATEQKAPRGVWQVRHLVTVSSSEERVSCRKGRGGSGLLSQARAV